MPENFKDTIFLPQTEFQMRASLSKKEPEILEHFERSDIYGKLREISKNRKKYRVSNEVLISKEVYMKKVIRVLTLRETIERNAVVQHLKTHPEARITLYGGVLALVGGGLKLYADKTRFDRVVYSAGSDNQIYEIPARKCPTIEKIF